MGIEQINHFIFHLSDKINASPNKIRSLVSEVALGLFIAGTFAIAYLFVNWQRHKTGVKKIDLKSDDQTSSVLKKTIDLNPVGQEGLSKESHSQVKSQEETDPLPSKNDPSLVSVKKIEADQIKVKEIKAKQAEQLKSFVRWARAKQWKRIHNAHYDWWMFPVERPSSGHGTKYAVSRAEVDALKADAEFMKNYRRGVALVVQAWGWDLAKNKAIRVIDPKTTGQQWTGYGVRLAKMSDSLRLFGQMRLHKRLQLFFKKHCLSQQDQIRISDLAWLKKTLIGEGERQPET
jgi:hypothetical protein